MCNNDTNQNTDISTLQFIHKLHNYNFMHIISMHSNGASHYPVPVPAGYASRYLVRVWFRQDFKNVNIPKINSVARRKFFSFRIVTIKKQMTSKI